MRGFNQKDTERYIDTVCRRWVPKDGYEVIEHDEKCWRIVCKTTRIAQQMMAAIQPQDCFVGYYTHTYPNGIIVWK